MARVGLEQAVWLLLCSLAAGGFYPIAQHEFINFDDITHVVHNPRVNDGLTLEGIRWALMDAMRSGWIPLTWISLMIDCSLFGLDAGRHHLSNLLLHAINACLLFSVLLRLTRPVGQRPVRTAVDEFWLCALVAALFAVHPAGVESVAWISQRKSTLSTTFWLLSMGAYVRYARRPRTVGRYSLVVVCFVLGLMCKPMLVTLPFVFLLLDYWPLERFRPLRRNGGTPGSATDLVIEKVPLLLVSVVASGITFWVQRGSGAVKSLEWISLAERLANVPISYVRYLGMLFWPRDLAIFYPRLESDVLTMSWTFVGASALVLSLTALALGLARKHPYLMMGWLWYLGTLVPVIGVVQVGEQSIADRYTYVPYIGLFIMCAWGAAAFWPPGPAAQRAGVALAAAVLIGLLGATRRQVAYWQESVTVWSRAVEVTAENFTASSHLSGALGEAGRVTNAYPHARRAVELRPDSALARHNLATILVQLGRVDEARRQFEGALSLAPGQAESRASLADLLRKQGEHVRAVELFESAFDLNPRLVDAPPLRSSYAAALMGQLKARQSSLDETVESHRRALERHPDWVEIENNLAWILATHPEATESHALDAIAHASHAANAAGGPAPSILDTLAAAHAAAGRFEEAVALAERALELAARSGDEGRVHAFRKRLELYRARRPYREE